MRSRLLLALLFSSALAGSTLAQDGVIHSSQLPGSVAWAQALAVGEFSLQSLEIPREDDGSLQFEVSLGGQIHSVWLTPHSVRSPTRFQVLAQLEDGSYQPVDAPPSQTWRGHLPGLAGSRVAATVADGSVEAVIRMGDDGPVWGIHPARTVQPGFDAADHLVYMADDLLSRGESCGGALDLGGHASSSGGSSGGESSSYAGGPQKLCEVACDADVEFYNKNSGSVLATELDIESVINVVEIIYEADVDITYEITTIIVRTAEPDPYTSTNSSSLLSQFRSHWNSQQQGIARDVAHLFTGKQIDGNVIGIAYLSVICSSNQGYGLSQSKFAGAMVSRAALTAHEMGHNWSAGHCDGQPDCRIMCSGLGGCTGVLTAFGPNSINSITNKKNSVGCLSNAPPPAAPTLTSVQPATVSALGGGTVLLGGDDFYEANLVQVGPLNLAPVSGYQIINDATISIGTQQASVLGPVPVTVSGPGGTSATLSYTVVPVAPPVLIAPTLIATHTETSASWTVAGTPGSTVYFLVDFDAGTFSYHGFNVLLTALPVLSIPLNAAGVGQLVVPIDPSMGGVGLYSVYTQAVFFTPAISAVSPVKLTLVF